MVPRQLPARPNLEQYKKQAKELVKAWKAGDRATFARIREHHPRLSTGSDADLQRATFTLADAQFVIAREHAFDSWPKFTSHIEAVGSRPPVDEVRRLAQRATIDGDAATLDALLRDHRQLLRFGRRGRCTFHHREGTPF